MKRLFRGWSWEYWYNLAREDIEEAFDAVRRAARMALYAGLALWVLSGLHIIKQDEVGVSYVCGRMSSGVEKPGLRYRLPWPAGAVVKVPVERQQRVTVGIPEGGLTAAMRRGDVKVGVLDETVASQFDENVDTKGSELDSAIREGAKSQIGQDMALGLGNGLAVLTADHNVLLIQAVVQYYIGDPKQFLIQTEDAELILKRATVAALIESSAGLTVDEVLTDKRPQMQSEVRDRVNRATKALGMGVEVAGVELQRLAAPDPVAAAFRNVNTAREEMETIKNEAQQYEKTVVPQAEGEAAKIVADAESYKTNRIAETTGEASRFAGVLREQQQSGSLTGERLRLETLERVLGKANKVQVGGSNASGLDVNVIPPAPGNGP